MADPIEQFQIHNIFHLGKIGSLDISFTNSALYMTIAVGLTAALMLGATAGRELVPGRLQSIAELAYEFVADTIRNTIGEGGMRFFPLVFSLFMFIFVSNMIGLIPYNFTVASHLVVTVALALIVRPSLARLVEDDVSKFAVVTPPGATSPTPRALPFDDVGALAAVAVAVWAGK